ncbi:MAG: 5-formyltetrahydrofolate cyclo-ligase [Amaricoccus sp.]
MSDVDLLKETARAEGYVARARAHAAGCGAARQAAGHALLAISGHRDVRIVSAYLPIRTEIDPRPTMMALHGLGYRLAVPVVEAPGRPLRFRAWSPGCALEPGPFNVMVPVAGDWLEPDLLIVPLIAFDPQGHRLGYGGGFYDRTLQALRLRRPIHAYGLAYEGQLVPAVPRGPTDAELDGVVTEAGLHRPLDATGHQG